LGYYNGVLDELRVYSRELSALEVCALAKYWFSKGHLW
jgi:hypothetical protein